MKELSIFIDESGDFGPYETHAPYYIIAMVCHDQSEDISSAIKRLDQELAYLNLEKTCIHTGPIIRREEIYQNMTQKERRTIFNKMIAFARQIDFRYKCFSIEKKHIESVVEATSKLSKQISAFVRDHYEEFLSYDVVKVYYDNGQVEVTKILSSVFGVLLPGAEFRRVMPKDYKLFQVADLLCSMELVRIKLANKQFSKSEQEFFGRVKDLKKNYLQRLKQKEWN